MKAVQDTGTVKVPESFRDRLISSRELIVQADYWKIPANSLQDARRIKQGIEQGNNQWITKVLIWWDILL